MKMFLLLTFILLSGFTNGYAMPTLYPHCDYFSSIEDIKNSLNLKVGDSFKFDEIEVCTAPNYMRHVAIAYYQTDAVCQIDEVLLKVVNGMLVSTDDYISSYYSLKDGDSCHNDLSYTDLTNIADGLDPVKLIVDVKNIENSLKNGDISEISRYFELSFWDKHIDSSYRVDRKSVV